MHIRRVLPLALSVGLLVACGGGGGGGTTAVDEADIASWRTRDARPLMSFVSGSSAAWPYESRLWQSSTRPAGVIHMWGALRLGSAQREGIVDAAWASSQTAEAAVPGMRFVMFEQGADGLMREATASYVDNDMTDGAGHVTVADLNGDGRDDFVLPMYTETPVTGSVAVPQPLSLALVSQPDGRFARVPLDLAANGPHMDAVEVNGRMQLFVPNTSYTDAGGWEATPTWRWNGAGFSKLFYGPVLDLSSQALASAVLVRPFKGDGELWMVRSDNHRGPGLPGTGELLTRAWRLAADPFAEPPLALPRPYFNGKAAYASMESWLDPDSKTHNARLWSTDLNQDGLPDIIAGAQVWSGGRGLQQAQLQLLVNQGGMTFADQTDALRPEFRVDGAIDYTPRFVDVDGSGIETILMSDGGFIENRARHGVYILVNDGTGRLYAAMDAEFTNLSQQVLDHVNAQPALFADSRSNASFMAYRRADGKLNFLARVRAMRRGVIDPGSQQIAFVNVPLAIDITTGFKRALTVPTRNGSRNIRTFAGDDTIHRALADPDCRIDGGAGTNTAVYPGRRADWVITKTGAVITVAPAAGGGTDRLTRIQRARFDDQTVDLTAL